MVNRHADVDIYRSDVCVEKKSIVSTLLSIYLFYLERLNHQNIGTIEITHLIEYSQNS